LSLAIALSFTGILYQFRGEAQAAQEWSAAATVLAQEHGFPFWEATAMIVWGWAQVLQGTQAEGMARLHEGLRIFQTTTADIQMPSWLALLAEAYSCTGQVAEGHHTIDTALNILHRTDERYYEPELYRLKGDFYMQQLTPETTHTETCLRQALMLARQRGAKAWELRAAVSLSRLWQRQGKGSAARQLVGEIYDWFTEGWDTPDLQKARAFLERSP
jgi:predicted ATPase